jgi:hypothetical protein
MAGSCKSGNKTSKDIEGGKKFLEPADRLSASQYYLYSTAALSPCHGDESQQRNIQNTVETQPQKDTLCANAFICSAVPCGILVT